MEAIIAPVSKHLIESELTKEKFVRHTSRGGNLLYVVTAHDSPNTMHEIGRLREIAFRSGGGGTGKSIDIDEFDLQENPYKQLIVWDPKAKEIIGGYRYIVCDGVKIDQLATSELFIFSQRFIDQYIPYTIELGRSFVQPDYQSSRLRHKGIYALDNLWDGLGALVLKYPNVKYFLGKVTMYVSYNEHGRNMLLYFLRKHFSDNEELVIPIKPLITKARSEEMEAIFTGKTYLEDYRLLSKQVRMLGEHIPPLINSYMNLSPSMKVFGTAINEHFGGVEETGILIKIDDIYSDKIERYVGPLRKMANRIRRFSKW